MHQNEIGTLIVDGAVRLTGMKPGYLLNFGETLMNDGSTRIVYGAL